MSWLKRLFGRPAQPAPERIAPAVTVALPLTDGPVQLYQDQVLRKAWAEDVLRAQNIPINAHLPAIESEAEIALRTPRAVADRLHALVTVAFKGAEAPDQSLIDTIVAERELRSLFTPDERAFIDNPAPDERSRIRFSWRCEAAWVLLWALRHVDGELGPPGDMCDVPFLSETVFQTSDLAANGLRAANDILNEADLIYRCHWAVRQVSLDGVQPPAGLHPGVTMERHHAFNWLIGYGGLEWDDVSTDT